MGGKNPAIVMDSADLDKAAQGVYRSAFGMNGHKCSACSRVYVHRAVADAFTEKLVKLTEATKLGNPLDKGVFAGPLATKAGYEDYQRFVALAAAAGPGVIRAGGKVVTDGDFAHGYFARPTVLAGLPRDHQLMREELFVPILKDMPFVHALNLTLGDRYSKYNNFGNTNNTKVALEWRPIEDLLLRGTVSQVFRAPTVLNLFGAAANDAPRLSHDPCDGYTGNPPNPACVNVPTDGTFHNQSVAQQLQINAITSGSEFAGFPLGPELGKSFDWGVVYDPHFIEGLSVSADYWRL